MTARKLPDHPIQPATTIMYSLQVKHHISKKVMGTDTRLEVFNFHPRQATAGDGFDTTRKL
jgi:hypothetical protein